MVCSSIFFTKCFIIFYCRRQSILTERKRFPILKTVSNVFEMEHINVLKILFRFLANKVLKGKLYDGIVFELIGFFVVFTFRFEQFLRNFVNFMVQFLI